jgi:hypothetical protein
VSGHAVTCVQWVPGSEDRFISSHEDGTMYVYDKNRLDPVAAQSDKDFGRLPHAGYVLFVRNGVKTDPKTLIRNMFSGVFY